jgi:hypothetical protein
MIVDDGTAIVVIVVMIVIVELANLLPNIITTIS